MDGWIEGGEGGEEYIRLGQLVRAAEPSWVPVSGVWYGMLVGSE